MIKILKKFIHLPKNMVIYLCKKKVTYNLFKLKLKKEAQ